MATSLKERWVLGSYCPSVSTVTSPEWQKEKNVVRQAAHSIVNLSEESANSYHS